MSTDTVFTSSLFVHVTAEHTVNDRQPVFVCWTRELAPIT